MSCNSEAAGSIGQRNVLLKAQLIWYLTALWPFWDFLYHWIHWQHLALLEWCPTGSDSCLKPAANTSPRSMSLGTKEWGLEWPLSPFHLISCRNIVLFPCDIAFSGFGCSSAQEKNHFLREYWKSRLPSGHFGIPCITEFIGTEREGTWNEYPDYQEDWVGSSQWGQRGLWNVRNSLTSFPNIHYSPGQWEIVTTP